MKKLIVTLAVLLFSATAANAEFLGGLLYTGATTPGGGYTTASPSRTGTAHCNNFMYLISIGDCSVKTAMKNGGIRTLGGYDVQRESYLGFQKITVRAWGN